MKKNNKLGLIGKTILWGIGTLGTLGFISGCEEQQQTNQQVKITPQNLCEKIRCDEVNCYSSIDNSFCLTRQQLIQNWTNFTFKSNYQNNPEYFINTTMEEGQLPEVKENFKIFRVYAIAKLGVSRCNSTDCFYNGEKLCSRSDFEDVVGNIYTQKFLRNETSDIENWYLKWEGFPKVQQRIKLLESEWVKQQQFAQLRRQQNPNNNQVIVQQQQQPGLEWQALGVLFQGLGSDIVGYEYMKRN